MPRLPLQEINALVERVTSATGRSLALLLAHHVGVVAHGAGVVIVEVHYEESIRDASVW